MHRRVFLLIANSTRCGSVMTPPPRPRGMNPSPKRVGRREGVLHKVVGSKGGRPLCQPHPALPTPSGGRVAGSGRRPTGLCRTAGRAHEPGARWLGRLWATLIEQVQSALAADWCPSDRPRGC